MTALYNYTATTALLAARETTSSVSSSTSSSRPASYKVVGICLAVASGFFIGTSFVLKKIGLLRANVKYNEEAGEGYGYLKNLYWWGGMTLMIVGEICNFVAYAFVDAILVTPLGALTVVVCTVLSAIFLKERLSFVGKVGCFCCIIGSVVIPLNAPEQSSVSNIQEMKHYVIAPGFLSYAGVIIAGCIFTALYLGPRYGKKSMFVYLSICSLIGGLSVVATQGLGSAILAQINGESQFKEWFLYVLLVFVVATLLTEIIYLNKALNIFNAALVTPTYYVFFTSATIVTSAVLFQGFHGSVKDIVTVVLGFLQICAGVVLLQLSKSAKDVPDAAVFKGDLNQVREVATQEEHEFEPKADSIRGAAAIIRRISTPRRTMEAEEARRYYRDRQEDLRTPLAENEIVEWDGLRRRKTVLGEGPTMAARARTPSVRQPPLPPLGMARVPEEQNWEAEKDNEPTRPATTQSSHSFLDDLRSRANNLFHPAWQPLHKEPSHLSDADPVSLTAMAAGRKYPDTHYTGPVDNSIRSIVNAEDYDHIDPPSPPAHGGAERQFSFNSVIGRMKASSPEPVTPRSVSRQSGHHHQPHNHYHRSSGATEEERLGLVRGDSRSDDLDGKALDSTYDDDDIWNDGPDPLPSGHLHRADSPESHRMFSSESLYPARLRVNPLPPLPDEEPLADPYAPIGMTSLRRESDSSAGTFVSSPPARGSGNGGSSEGWRRHRSGLSSGGGSGGLPGKRGTFI
ncbi:DUF803 domain membrane protein [Aspergillus homomorphus CBS 101889]|uniref:DUF803-domain-containing protein n=1 Tax=Aspergillus homomorphus (strain CBS 101889) TaxID=1450537 RepID=A0A395I4C2_ASPHC|nr:DUF803-domain-containing protein [Aspergillus homomorphus CBS 101889]RAL15052.1 DUF803-domain-containing protein [Aspergillus homomorphus CBS 101889]